MSELKNYTILVVDDETDLRESIAFDFKRKGFNVLEAENGVDAFELIKKNTIHLVISDMRMPGGGGMDLLAQIKKYNPKIPTLIFITGFSDVTEEQALAKGASRVITKPFERKALLEASYQALGLTLKV